MRIRKQYNQEYWQRPEVKLRDKLRREKRRKQGYYKKYWQKPEVQEKNRKRIRNNHLEILQKNKLKNECQICGWKKSVCDIHHITKEKVIVLCPNHHRIIHRNEGDGLGKAWQGKKKSSHSMNDFAERKKSQL